MMNKISSQNQTPTKKDLKPQIEIKSVSNLESFLTCTTPCFEKDFN